MKFTYVPIANHPYGKLLIPLDRGQSVRAEILLRENIRALLYARREDQKSLAVWCGHAPSWISKVLSGERGVATEDLGKIADFFGLTCAELFQFGISSLTERRKRQRRAEADRRSGQERRGTRRDTVHPSLHHKWTPKVVNDGK